jgi:hypothetical protein
MRLTIIAASSTPSGLVIAVFSYPGLHPELIILKPFRLPFCEYLATISTVVGQFDSNKTESGMTLKG